MISRTERLLYDMAFLMSHYDDEYYNTEDMAALFYECIHDLIDLAGNYGFTGICGTAIWPISW